MTGSQTCSGHGRFFNNYLGVGYKTECAWDMSNRSAVVNYRSMDNSAPSSYDTCVESQFLVLVTKDTVKAIDV